MGVLNDKRCKNQPTHPFGGGLPTHTGHPWVVDGNVALTRNSTQHAQLCGFHHERRRLLKHENRVFCD
jgi:hypothetical protein